jgi:hypothetical protein
MQNLLQGGLVMSEETVKQKQFLLMVDEVNMAILSRLLPSLQFCQVEGLSIPDNSNYHLLANPTPKPVELVDPVVP